MQFAEALEKLEKSAEFRDWKKENVDSYISCGFLVIDGDQMREWQIGYYNKVRDTITNFVIGDNDIEIGEASDVFKEENTTVKKLELSEVKLNLSQALEAALKVKNDKYMQEIVIKKIILLQNLEKYGNIWNVTFVTKAFKTLNIKINANDGAVLEDGIISVIEFEK